MARTRNSKRSPIKKPPLSTAGASIQSQLINVLFDQGVTWVLIAAFLFVLAAMEWARWIWSIPPAPLVATLAAVVVAIIAAFKARRTLRQADQLQLGREGELTVAEFLEPLRASGYRVYHDIQEDGFNIDHALIGPAGVFVIETKTVSLSEGNENKIKFDGEKILVNGHTPDRNPVEQVRACADRIREILSSSTGRAIPMRRVVLYPGWWVDPQPRNADVWVLNPKALSSFVGREPKCLTPADVALFSSALETYMRSRKLGQQSSR